MPRRLSQVSLFLSGGQLGPRFMPLGLIGKALTVGLMRELWPDLPEPEPAPSQI